MKIKKSLAFKKIVLLFILLALVVGSTVLALYYTQKSDDAAPGNDSAAVNGEPKFSPSTKGDVDTTAKQPGSTPVPKPTPPPQEGGESTVSMEITAANQNDSSVAIRTLIKTITSQGVCKLTIEATDSGKTYRSSADVQALPSSTTCKGFSVLTSELGSGEWNITVAYESESVKGDATRKIIVR